MLRFCIHDFSLPNTGKSLEGKYKVEKSKSALMDCPELVSPFSPIPQLEVWKLALAMLPVLREALRRSEAGMAGCFKRLLNPYCPAQLRLSKTVWPVCPFIGLHLKEFLSLDGLVWHPIPCYTFPKNLLIFISFLKGRVHTFVKGNKNALGWVGV